VTRRIIGGLPTYLRPGGMFHCTCTATDREDVALEHRLRTMLGDRGNEFDIAVIVLNEFNPTEYYVRLAIGGRCTWAEAEEWHNHFAAQHVSKMVYATIAIIRHEHPHEPFTVRRRVGSATGAVEIGRLVRAAEESASPDALARLLDRRPIMQSHVQLESKHVREAEGWAVRSCLAATDVPFDVRLPCPPAMITLLGQMDGTRTLRQVYSDAEALGTLADDATIDQLASYVHMLAAHGLVGVDS
jgi:hypothetical protein